MDVAGIFQRQQFITGAYLMSEKTIVLSFVQKGPFNLLMFIEKGSCEGFPLIVGHSCEREVHFEWPLLIYTWFLEELVLHTKIHLKTYIFTQYISQKGATLCTISTFPRRLFTQYGIFSRFSFDDMPPAKLFCAFLKYMNTWGCSFWPTYVYIFKYVYIVELVRMRFIVAHH